MSRRPRRNHSPASKAAVIDFGNRAGNIHNSYQAGGNWERDMFIESSSFAASAITGTAVVNVGAAASIGMNGYVKDNSGNLYDDIMNLVSRL